jgi:hypothetical protein
MTKQKVLYVLLAILVCVGIVTANTYNITDISNILTDQDGKFMGGGGGHPSMEHIEKCHWNATPEFKCSEECKHYSERMDAPCSNEPGEVSVPLCVVRDTFNEGDAFWINCKDVSNYTVVNHGGVSILVDKISKDADCKTKPNQSEGLLNITVTECLNGTSLKRYTNTGIMNGWTFPKGVADTDIFITAIYRPTMNIGCGYIGCGY